MDFLMLHSNVFVAGVMDFISIHKTFPLLVNDNNILLTTLQIISANTVLIIGSIALYYYIVNPLVISLQSQISDNTNSNNNDSMGWSLYQLLWLLPILLLCYSCSMNWYQDLSNSTFKYLKIKVNNSCDIKKSLDDTIYGLLVWLYIFIQVQLLTSVSPIIFNNFIIVIDVFFDGLQSNNNISPMIINTVLKPNRHIIITSLQTLLLLLKILGFSIMSLLYGWYSYDYKWIALGIDPNKRFGLLEKHWSYFMGFGFIYTVILRNTNFFLGYGIFLGTFPFAIMLAAQLSHQDPYKLYGKQAPKAHLPIPFFMVAKEWTTITLKYINNKVYDSSNNANNNSSKSKPTVSKAKKIK